MASASVDHGVKQTPSAEEQAVIREAIVTCYREVWTEFYEWEPRDSLQTLQSLSIFTTPMRPLYDLVGGDWTLYDGNSNGNSVPNIGETTLQEFEICEWDNEGVPHERAVPCAVVLAVTSEVTPHPRYEACTPAYSCIDPDISSSESECRFIKYAGLPNFDEVRYLRSFHSISWQQPWRDPDRESFYAAHTLTSEFTPYNCRARNRSECNTTTHSLGSRGSGTTHTDLRGRHRRQSRLSPVSESVYNQRGRL